MTTDNYIKHRFHGRRKGKALTPKRQALLDNVYPQYKIDSGLRLDDRQLSLGDFNQTWLEIGFGNGEFLAHMCQNHPDIQFIGCEPFVNGIAALLSAINHPVDNLGIWDDNARIIMDALPDQSLDRVYLLNPDPWPKTRHEKRRFVQEESLTEIARLLKPDGLFIASTDSRPLFEWMRDHLLDCEGLSWTGKAETDWLKTPDDWPIEQTRYMKKGLAGHDIYWLIFKKNL